MKKSTSRRQKMLEILPFVVGPLDNNTYLVVDPSSREAAVVDPGLGSGEVYQAILEHKLSLRGIWLTHAHFDHIGGAAALCRAFQPAPLIALHADDLPLWQQNGGADHFRIKIERAPLPGSALRHGELLRLGEETIEVRHTPGHTRGHVIFYLPSAGTALVGDLIFREGVGRTDLPGGDSQALQTSIRQQVFSLPPETRLLPGHGPQTSVAHEQQFNPYLA
jgi:hydroxyacylglutathione hydrolase